MANSSEIYLGTDGYKPLGLPQRGEELAEGRQYVLTPLARHILKEAFGLVNIPIIVECIRRKVAATRITHTTENLETGKVSSSVTELLPQDATFRVLQPLQLFILDLAKLEELAPFYAQSHKLPEDEQKWFETSVEQPLARRLRGVPLRWWKQGHDSKPYRPRVAGAKQTKEIDLSILDLA